MDPIFPFDMWVDFEEAYPLPAQDVMMTFRVHVHVRSPSLWGSSDFEVKSTVGRDNFLPVTSGDLTHFLYKAAVSSDAGYAWIEDRITSEIAERRNGGMRRLAA